MPHKFLDLRGRLPIESEISLTAFYSPFRDECVNIRIDRYSCYTLYPCTIIYIDQNESSSNLTRSSVLITDLVIAMHYAIWCSCVAFSVRDTSFNAQCTFSRYEQLARIRCALVNVSRTLASTEFFRWNHRRGIKQIYREL